jgi:putative ubiquitin-RnfH superfamily antitoxin RatB of RatAB toxin-antitoxin module
MARIYVKVAQLATALKNIIVTTGATVEDVFKKAEITANGDIFVNGNRAGLRSKVKNGDIIGIVGQVEGGM